LKSEVFPESEDRSDQKLSRKNDLIVWLRPSEYQRKLYTAFLNSETAEESWAGGRSALAALAVMKKICDHPSLLTVRAANDIAEGMEGILDSDDVATAEDLTKSLAGMIQDDYSTVAPSCKIVFLMALLVTVSTLVIPQLLSCNFPFVASPLGSITFCLQSFATDTYHILLIPA
jgi:SNF2 family DNA or RNA helicase